MPMYWADYQKKTNHLSTIEHGAYMLLIAHYWVNGALPDDDKKLSRIARLTLDEWMEIRSTISEFFYDGWKHHRLEEEFAIADSASEIARDKARKSHEARRQNKLLQQSYSNSTVIAAANVGQLLDTCPSPSPTPNTNSNELVLSEPSSDQKRKKRNSYSEDFETFWKAYPTDDNMSKAEAWQAWKTISSEEREMAIRSIPAFRAYCVKNPDYRPIHANRYILKKRFEGHAQSTERLASVALVSVSQDSPAGKAWEAFVRQSRGKGVPWTNGSWRFPSEWPPPLPEVAQQTSEATQRILETAE